jgi:hypothetical protein
MLEASVFNGREPDEDRWDFDFGRMDSVSGRVWLRPSDRWEFQVSTGHLVEPEELSHGNVQRTTASGSWFRRDAENFTAVTVGYGANAAHETTRHAVFGEATHRVGKTAVFGRAEIVQVETDVLLNGEDSVSHDTLPRKDPVGAFTFGGLRDLGVWRGFEGGFGASVTLYAVPDALRGTHGDRPVSLQVFFRVRPPAGSMGRMWNMRMSRPMAGHPMP